MNIKVSREVRPKRGGGDILYRFLYIKILQNVNQSYGLKKQNNPQSQGLGKGLEKRRRYGKGITNLGNDGYVP